MRAVPLPVGPNVLSTSAGYDRWAEIYDDDGNPLIALEHPEVRRLMGEVTGLDVADLGCGTGRHSLWMAQAGARVTALDFSRGMLDKAAAKEGAEGVRFLAHDLEQPLPLPDAAFDRVLCGLVVEHIRNLRGLFAEMRRICRPDGFVVVSAMHPAMMLLGTQAGFTDPATGEKLHPQSHPNQISDFLMAALGAGLTLELISEHAVDHALAARVPRAEKYLGWLMLLMLRLRPR
jgi:malonyl-CoA O-methyltransferase